MPEAFNDFNWNSLWSWGTVLNIIDILIVAFFIYQIIRIIRGTRVSELFKGIMVIVFIKIGSSIFQLHTTEYIIDIIIQWSAIALIVIFQPELRKGLEHIGRNSLFSTRKQLNPNKKIVNDIADACQYMGRRHIGALISIELQNSLDEYINTGIPIDAEISRELLINIFIPNTPLHDGAVIISGHKIASAASYLPLSESASIPKKYGTRHRAAIGLSEATDALTIIVSEETGDISVTKDGNIMTELTKDDLLNYLSAQLVSEENMEEQSWWNNVVESIRKVVNDE